MKDIIEKVDKKNKLNEKNILKNDFNSDFVDFLEKLFPITEENKIEEKITCCEKNDNSQCKKEVESLLDNEVLRKRIFNGEKLEDIFDKVGEWENGVACVKHNGLNNLINTKLQLISDEWFDECHLPKNGFSVVKKDYQYNYINTEGKILSHSQWFDYVGTFSEGFAWVHLDEKGYNYINQNGDILSPNQWFDNTDDFREGFARVELNGKYNFINAEGKLLSPNKWFDECGDFENGLAEIITSDDGVMFIDENGNCFEQFTPDDYWRKEKEYLKSDVSLNEEKVKETEGEEMIEEYNPTYQLFDSGGIYNPMFYNAVHYICETVHFPLSDIYRFEEKIELDELDGVILIPNVWGKLIDGEIQYFGEYIKNGGKVYVIDPNSFELTLVDSFSKLWDYAMTTTQMECL